MVIKLQVPGQVFSFFLFFFYFPLGRVSPAPVFKKKKQSQKNFILAFSAKSLTVDAPPQCCASLLVFLFPLLFLSSLLLSVSYDSKLLKFKAVIWVNMTTQCEHRRSQHVQGSSEHYSTSSWTFCVYLHEDSKAFYFISGPQPPLFFSNDCLC